MSIHAIRKGVRTVYKVRWREGGKQPARHFTRRRDAELFEAEIKRRRQLGTLAHLDAGSETLTEYVTKTWVPAHVVHLAPRTQVAYAGTYDRHIAPALGYVPLRETTPETIAQWRGAMVRASVGPEAIHKSMTLLGAILQRAAEAQRIPHNPARLVRKPKRVQRPEVRPLAPGTVEMIRSTLPMRDATIVSVLAYGGLRPHELRALRWRDVRERTLLAHASKTNTRRAVRLLAPLAADLAEWRLKCDVPPEDAPVFPGDDGAPWTANGFNKWRGRVFARVVRDAGLPSARPYDLRHSFASLLLHEGRSVIYVARQLGHGADLTLKTYGHVIDELEDAPRASAEDAIAAARGGGMFPQSSLASITA